MLKVDRSFIMDIPKNKDDQEITAAIIAMAHQLKLRVVAEGIETVEQLDFLRENKCEIGQGYLFCIPINEQAFSAFLETSMKIVNVSNPDTWLEPTA